MQLFNLSVSKLCARLKVVRMKEGETWMEKHRDTHKQNNRRSVAPERAAAL